jgi:hypothetical protein
VTAYRCRITGLPEDDCDCGACSSPYDDLDPEGSSDGEDAA